MPDVPSARSQRVLSRLVGGFTEPLRQEDLLSPDQPLKPYPPVHRWRYNSGIRALMMVLFTVAASLVVGLLGGLGWAVARQDRPFPLAVVGANTLAIPGFVVAYLVLARWWEQRRPPYELSPSRAGGLLYGLAWGVTLQLVCVGVLAMLGAFRVEGFDWAYNPVPAILSAGFGAAITEEIMFRGILFRLVEDTLGTWMAVAVSGLAFGLAHLSNPQGTLQGALAIALEAGVLFAALYALTRSLWLVMGLHFAWNVMQGPVLGIVLSGSSGRGVGYVRSTLTGPDWLAGGGFGMEASLVTVVILTAVAVWVLSEVQKRGLVVSRTWARRRRLVAQPRSAEPDGSDSPVS